MGADIPIPHQPGPALPRSVNVVAMSKSRDYAYDRCSREQPKCATCRPWPGECVYSKEVSAPRYQTGASSANTGILYPTKKDLDSFQERLSRIEAALEKLARAVDSLNPNMNRVDATFASEKIAGFFIPSRALGYTLIGRFLNISDLADLIAIKPSDQILMEVIFEPASVTQRSWVLYINFIFLIISHKDQTLSHLTTSFRHNIRLALDDAKIFLEPNEVNVQALTMLSCLGEDYTSPSLSWMLASHACRQAQALSLHFTEQHYSTEQQRRLTLFWVVFMVDKACALVFGHPILLSSKLYENVPLPDFQHLLKFRPRYGQSNNVHSQLYLSTFGAHFLTQNIKLARLTGLILDIPTNGSQHSGREGLISYLDDWDVSTRQILSEARGLEADHASEEQLRGMSLAIRLMRFKYLHILVLTLPEDVQYATLRLESSREALSLLSHLSSKHHVYRGIFWTLLYYPFTSFFVVFNHITCNPEAPTTSGDLDLLTTTLSYFQSMKVKLHTQSVVTSELEKMVESFIQLARSAVSKDIPSYT
ncbi:hypothetical protein CI102_13294 [Trichoderma harzianum]|uniref:Xylanolytic transcriptional activator regulatory domain-containing protein n=1 Tax=Trichoderma harzianum CBS 226.95 TaxID=983964 RepID=A0A2T3ZVA0_TRIHA|nr:hypothetical protein M431DRAFT_500931 [Trichoderma harzianum CBS 226.95]PKK43136.1 hypothetical protein CI102_13294 [Trichoderma harzianum]PTB48734.1 hypothetical protein M431DRAFT_500931 [Trichoderma harzianum CBS 226.95]